MRRARRSPVQREFRTTILTALALLAPTAVAVLTYAISTSYSFMYDDPLDLPRGLGQSVWRLLSTSGDYTYYRPFPFLLWVGMYNLLGSFDPFWFHLIVVLVHGINACLVALLVMPLGGRMRAFAVGLVFALFPLSYQAVSWASSLFHPLMTLFVLTCLLCYRANRRSGSLVAALGAVAATILGLLTHEGAVTIAPLVLWYELVCLPVEQTKTRLAVSPREPPPPTGKAFWSRWLLATVVCFFVGAYAIVYRAIPKAHAPFSVDVASVKLNALYLAQGIALPPLELVNSNALGTAITIVLGCAATLACLLVLQCAQRTIRLAVFALGWLVIAWAPSLLALPFTYVVDAPRLLYLPSVGIALLWGGALGPPSRDRLRMLGSLLGLLAVAAFCVQGWRFVRRHEAMYVAGSHLMFAMQAAATRFPDGVLFVNPLSWIGPKQSDYPLGHTGITMVPTYVGLDQVERLAVGRNVKVAWTGYDVLRKPWRYDYGELGGNASLEQLDAFARQSRAVYVTDFGENGSLVYAGALRSNVDLDPVEPIQAVFEGGDTLISAATTGMPQRIELELTWYAFAEATSDNTIFVHLDGPDGKPAAQSDGYPLLGISPPRLWKPREKIIDYRRIDIPPGLAPGVYSLGLGMYRRDTGARLAAVDQSGARIASDTVVVASIRLSSSGVSITSTRSKG